jgi:Tfp pilus assembly protein PilF
VRVADAARASRAHHAQSSAAVSAPTKHGPFSQTQLLAWQIAGVSDSDFLTELRVNGIAFAPDEAHLSALKDALFPSELITALPTVPSYPEVATLPAVPQAMITASQAFHSKDYTAARQALEALVRQTPRPDLCAALGNVQFLSHDLRSAALGFERAVQLDPNFVYAHVRLAGIYYSLANGTKTGAEAKKALQLQPDNAQAHKYLALSLSMRLQAANSSNEDRIEDLSDLESKDGYNQEAKDLNNQALVLIDRKEWKKAEAALQGAIALDPKVALFYYNLGNLYVKWGHHNLGLLPAYEKAKALAPRNLAVRQNLGAYLCEHHSYDRAILEFREILAMDPSWNMARPCLYEALFNTRRRNEAGQVLAEYRYWNQITGTPDDSDEIDATNPKNQRGTVF